MMNNTIEENRITMSNIRIGRTIFFVIDLLFCLFDMVFYIVGGFMFFFIFDFIAIASAYIVGTVTFRNRKLHIYLIAASLIAIILYAIIQPVHKFMYISSIIQHVLCVVQLLCFMNMGKQQERLMDQEGYPYFTEQSAMISGYKEYVPENHISSGKCQMDDLDPQRHSTQISDDQTVEDKMDPDTDSMQGISKITDQYNQQPRRSDSTTEYNMYEISDSCSQNLEIKSDKKSDYQMPGVSYDSIALDENDNSEEKNDKKEYSELFNVKPKSHDIPEFLCAPDVMAENKHKMNSLKFTKKLIFAGDIMMIIETIFMFAFHIPKLLYVSPLYILILFNIIVIITASVISETCLDNISFCRKMILVYFLAGVGLTALCFKYVIPFSCYVCAGQMILLEILARKNNYLKQQQGYPYFNEAALRHGQYTDNYSPTYDIDFSPKKMDSI